MGRCPARPKPSSQLHKNCIAMQEVPHLPAAPSAPKQSRQNNITLRTSSGGICSRSNRKLTALSSEVGPQSYSVIW